MNYMDAWEGENIHWDRVVPPPANFARACLQVCAKSLADEYSSVISFLRSIFTLDSLLVASIAVASPCFFYYYYLDGRQLAYNQSWTLIAIFLVFPLTMTMTSAFTRRETALLHLSLVKANLTSIFIAHRHWDWFVIPKDSAAPCISGRAGRLPSDHVDQVFDQIIGLSCLLRSALKAPTVSRLRHMHTSTGRQIQKLVLHHTRLLHEHMAERLKNLSALAEEFKAAGLPANEATRIRQHFKDVINSLMQLRFIKHYRTPLGLRAFARLFILLLPILYGPYYASLANSTHIGFSTTFSVCMSMALQGLFNLRTELEDPFVPTTSSHDAIEVDMELDGFENELRIYLKENARIVTSSKEEDVENT